MRDKISYSEAGKLGAIESAKIAREHKQKRIESWNTNPKLCKFCATPILYEKRLNNFCNHSCRASFSNKGIRRRGQDSSNCLNCENKTRAHNYKFCSNACQKLYEWKCRINQLLEDGIDKSGSNRIGKRYLIELHQGKCQICHKDQWCEKPMPLVLDHINGNSYDNQLTNLRVICHNCNAQTPTFTGRNRGKGRFERAKRYKIEKEVIDNMKSSLLK